MMYNIFKWTQNIKIELHKQKHTKNSYEYVVFYDILIKRKLTINTREMSMPGNYISSYMKKKVQCLNI